MSLVLGTLLWSVRLRSQNSISRANGERRSQIEKHVVVSVRSNLPLKSSTVLSGPPNQKFLVTRHVCIHVGVIPSEGKKEKGRRNYIQWPYHRQGRTKNSLPCKMCCYFYLLAFHILSTTLDTSNNKQWFTLLKLRGQTGWGEDSSLIKVQREWLLSIADFVQCYQ